MKILVFGGTGFLGSHLCEQLVNKGHEVGLYLRKESTNLKNIMTFEKEVNKIYGDFSTQSDFDKIVDGYDCVYQLVSTTVPSCNKPLEDIESTVKPTIRLLDACVAKSVKKVVFFSSGGTVYGIPCSIPIKETHPTNPISAYGIHKLILEKYLDYYYHMYGLQYVVLRIANPYGERQRAFSTQGLIANILGRYLSGECVEVWGDGSVTRDYLYVQDVVEAAEGVLSYTGKEKIFNVGSGRGYSINEIIRLLEEIVGNKIDIKTRTARKQDVPINVLDISLIQRELNWKPQYGLDMGIAKMLGAWNSKTKTFG